MILGILGDSHGDAAITTRAVELLRDGGAELLIYLGDVETEDVIVSLSAMPTRLVFGNCDFDIAYLTEVSQRLGVTVDHPAGHLDVDGKTVVFTHGHLELYMKQAIEQATDYLLHGHSHIARDDHFGSTRIINPGALHRAPRYTAALLDPASDRLDLVEVPRLEHTRQG